jgi:hypothetical protein
MTIDDLLFGSDHEQRITIANISAGGLWKDFQFPPTI